MVVIMILIQNGVIGIVIITIIVRAGRRIDRIDRIDRVDRTTRSTLLCSLSRRSQSGRIVPPRGRCGGEDDFFMVFSGFFALLVLIWMEPWD
jgi:hypothetical protein